LLKGHIYLGKWCRWSSSHPSKPSSNNLTTSNHSDFAENYPNAQVIGTDLSPMQPRYVPPNVRFEIDNAEDEWMYGENTFDFIHIRTLLGSIKDWDRLYRQAYRALKPVSTCLPILQNSFLL